MKRYFVGRSDWPSQASRLEPKEVEGVWRAFERYYERAVKNMAKPTEGSDKGTASGNGSAEY